MRRSRLILLAGVALLLLAVAAFWQARMREGDGSAALARGLAALDRGDARTARVELLNAIKADPRSVPARIAQARALVELGDGAGAQAELVRAHALGGAAADMRALLGQALLLQGNAEAALRVAQAADVPARDAPAAARVAANALLARGDAAAARAALDRALTLAPRDVRAWVDMGQLLLAAGDQAGAIRAAEQALALAPSDLRALTLRGVLIRDQYGLIAALPWFERALALDPDFVPALTEYAATLADAGQASRMLSVTRRILALDPANARAWFMQAVLAARAGRTDLARALLARTEGRLDRVPATLLLRGVLHLSDGNAGLAADALGTLVAMQPGNRVARTLLGRALYLGGDPAGAAAALAPLVARRDADPYELTLAARAREALGDRWTAGDLLARASLPDRPASDLLGDGQEDAFPPTDAATAADNIPYIRALVRAGQLDEAVARAQLLRDANPGAPGAHMALGDALDAAGRPADAARAYAVGANIRFDRPIALRLAAAWNRAGDAAQADRVIRLFLSQHPMDVEALRLAATAALRAGDGRGALRLLRAVRAQVGDNDALLMTDLARAALKSGDRTGARAYAAHAYRLMPANPLTADIYGWVLLRSGVRGRAPIDLLEKAVTLAPGNPLFRAHLEQAHVARPD